MKKSSVVALCAAGTALPLFLLAPGRASKEKKAPFTRRRFAHRGLYTRDKAIPENSLQAFALAIQAGYGIELDVQLSRDGQLVVFHDDTLDRVCGVSKRVDDLTYQELQELSLSGSEQRIPLFSDVLDLISGQQPLIVELKTGPRNEELCRKTWDALQRYQGDVCVESFNPFIVAWFRKNAPSLLRGQLAMPAEGYRGLSKALGFVASRTLLNVLARPQFIAYQIGPRPLTVRLAQGMGAMKIGWTSHGEDEEKGLDAVIFEFYKPAPRF